MRTKSGQLITDEMIQALADEAERGYDLDNLPWRWRPLGRPSLSDAGESPRVQYRVGADTYSRAKERAQREGVPTISALSRALLNAYADGTVSLPRPKATATAKSTTRTPKPRQR